MEVFSRCLEMAILRRKGGEIGPKGSKKSASQHTMRGGYIMKISKILFIGLVFVMVSIYWQGVPAIGSAEENELVAQLTKHGTTSPTKHQFDCKMVEEKDKSGNIIVKLIGRDCEKVAKQVNSDQEQKRVSGTTCCVCKREGTIIVCRGNCCDKRVPFYYNQSF